MFRGRLRRIWPLLCLGLAAVLRLNGLTWHSLDGDEGASLNLAHQTWATLLMHWADTTLDPHPMLYYAMLKSWLMLMGESDVALRLLSALSGIVVVALFYRVARSVTTRWAANVAVLLVASHPLLIAASQDVRMYALGLALNVAATWMLARSFDQPIYLWAFILLMTAACYSHLASGVLLAGLSVWAVMQLWQKKLGWQHWRQTALAFGGVLVLYLPYLQAAYANGQLGAPFTFTAWLGYGQEAVQWLLFYKAPVSTLWQNTGIVMLMLCVGWAVGRGQGGAVLAWGGLGLALLLYLAVRREALQPKTLVFIVPVVSLLVAQGVGAFPLGSALKGAGAVMALLPLLYGHLFLWRVDYQKEDFRQAARYLTIHAHPNDLALVHLSWYRFVLEHYYAGALAHPWGSQITQRAEVEAGLAVLPAAQVLWLVQAGTGVPGGDERQLVQQALDERYPVVSEAYPQGIMVRGYAQQYRFAALPLGAQPLAVVYANGLRLVGYAMPQAPLPTRDVWLHPPSSWAHITLYWSPTQLLPDTLRIECVLEDEAGHVWGEALPRTNDVLAFYPLNQWQVGEVVRQDVEVNINPAVAPGTYKLVVRVYPAEGQPPLTHQTGDDWLIVSMLDLY